MAKFTLKVEGKEYELEFQEDFASYMEKELEQNLSRYSNNSAKDLLSAYLKKCYECFLAEKKLQNLLQKL